MTDGFDIAANKVPDNIPDLFSEQGIRAALGAAGQSYNEGAKQGGLTAVLRADRLINNLEHGVERQNINKGAVRPTQTQPAATVDPQEIEARWMARLAKFAGISQATGVKIT